MNTICKNILNRNYILVLFLVMNCTMGYCQFTTYTYGGAGYSNPSAGVYKLTDDNGAFQVAAVWNNTPFDPTTPFNKYFNVYLGCLDETGADGLGFVFSPSMGIGDGGANMGAYLNGGSPSPMMPNDIVIIEFDTWDNGGSYGDIPNDHITISRYVNNFCCPPTSPVDMGNMEDNVLHTVRIRYTPPASEWDWDAGLLEVFYYPVGTPCPASPVISQGVNIRSITNSTSVYWGWTGSTGGNKNEQWFSYNNTATPPTYTTACTPLPLELLSFNAVKGKNNTSVNINWVAQSTDLESTIELYRSTDAQNWQLIHTSTSHSNNMYSEEVNDPVIHEGIYYYKLVMIDKDGIVTVSTIKSVSINGNNNSSNGMQKIYIPSGKTKIQFYSIGSIDWKSYEVSIIDVTGKVILSNARLLEIDTHSAELSLPSNLAEGIYLVKSFLYNYDNNIHVQ